MKIIAKDIETEYHNRLWYYKVYNNLINKSLNRGLNKDILDGYYERHHILPKSIGGKDIDSNYVLLTAKEHILAHMLLARIYPDNLNLVRSTSAMLMKNRGRVDQLFNISLKTITSIRENYANYKDEFSKEQLGKNITESHRENLSKSHIGKKLSESSKIKLKDSRFHIIVEGPDGTIYNSIKECARKLNRSDKTIKNWIEKHPELGYRYL